MPKVDRGRSVVSLVSEWHFVIATRDTGYRTTAAAVAELVDNSLQADATIVRVAVNQVPEAGLQVAVLDNGWGMNAAVLRTALQFGGTTRFNDRSGPGRYRMGLPNSSVSQARRLDVFSWRAPVPGGGRNGRAVREGGSAENGGNVNQALCPVYALTSYRSSGLGGRSALSPKWSSYVELHITRLMVSTE
jgi:Histidine kinase-, DNA gyrase B-, and HSP90-like ATPase